MSTPKRESDSSLKMNTPPKPNNSSSKKKNATTTSSKPIPNKIIYHCIVKGCKFIPTFCKWNLVRSKYMKQRIVLLTQIRNIVVGYVYFVLDLKYRIFLWAWLDTTVINKQGILICYWLEFVVIDIHQFFATIIIWRCYIPFMMQESPSM